MVNPCAARTTKPRPTIAAKRQRSFHHGQLGHEVALVGRGEHEQADEDRGPGQPPPQLADASAGEHSDPDQRDQPELRVISAVVEQEHVADGLSGLLDRRPVLDVDDGDARRLDDRLDAEQQCRSPDHRPHERVTPDPAGSENHSVGDEHHGEHDSGYRGTRLQTDQATGAHSGEHDEAG